MATVVRLHVLTGPHKATTFCIRDGTACTIGRGEGCLVQFTGQEEDGMVSRRHCLLHVALPALEARDLGSSNGTYLNGKPIHCNDPRGQGCPVALEDGDLLTLAGMTMRVERVECPLLGPDAPVGAWADEAPVLRNCQFPCDSHA